MEAASSGGPTSGRGPGRPARAAAEPGAMTSAGLWWRRLLSFATLAVIVGLLAGYAGHSRDSKQAASGAGGSGMDIATQALPDDAPGAATTGASPLSPTTVTPVAVVAAGKNATATATAGAAGAAAPTTSTAGGAAKPTQQVNLEKVLGQLTKPLELDEAAEQQQLAGEQPLPSGPGDAPQWATNVEGNLLGAAASMQGAKQQIMNYVAVAGCTPADGKDLQRMVDNPACPIITLKPRFNYSVSENIVVRRRVTIVGRPLGMPTIDANNATRVFYVLAGGHLDVRFVRLIKGRFIEVIRLLEYHMRGPTAYVRAGGSATFFGCIITVAFANALRFAGFTPGPQINIRVFGGGIVTELGVIRVTDCFFYYIRPGIIFRETQFIGGEFLALGGNVFVTGCNFFNMAIFSNSLGAGGYVANLGGSVSMTGCNFAYTGAFVCTQGLGYLFFLGGGVTTATGCNIATNLGMAAYFGGGIGMFTGGGVSVVTGLQYASEASLGFGVGLGFQAAVGGGISIRTGVIQSSMGGAGFGAGVGLSTYCGAGVTVFTDIILARSTGLLTYVGTSSYFYLGAGVATTTNVIGFFNTGCGAAAFGGGDSAVMTGWMTRSNHFYLSATAIQFAAGQGGDLFVGPGGAALLTNAYLSAPTPISWKNPGLASVYLAGNNIISVTKVGAVQVIFKIVALKRGVMDYRNNIFIARLVSWRFLNAGPRPGDFVWRHRRAEEELGAPLDHSLWGKDLNHLPVQEAIRHSRAYRRLMPRVPDHVHQPHRWAQASMDVKEYFLNATAGLIESTDAFPAGGAPGTEAGSTTGPAAGVVNAIPEAATETVANAVGSTDTAAAAEAEDAATTLAKALATGTASGGGEFNMTKYANNPWFYYANHPALKVEHSKTDKIYVRADLAACNACGVSSESGLTGTNIDGPGAAVCQLTDDCTKPGAATATAAAEDGTEPPLASRPSYTRMWVTEKDERPPNTTVATLKLRATFTPTQLEDGSYTTVTPAQVSQALNATIAALGLPDRFHLRVEPAPTELSLDPMFSPDIPEYLMEGSGENARRRYRELMQARERRKLQEAGYGEDGGQQECGRNELFQAFIVSDWRNVTEAMARGLRAGGAEAALTERLQALVDAEMEARRLAAVAEDGDAELAALPTGPAPQICSLVAYRSAALHLPSTTVAGVSQNMPKASSYAVTVPGSSTGSSSSSSSSGAAALAAMAGSFFDMLDGDEDDGLDPQSRLVLSSAPAAVLVHTPSPEQQAAAEAEEAADRERLRRMQEAADGSEPTTRATSVIKELPPRVQNVTRGEAYTLVLQSFPPGALLNLRLVPEVGANIPLGVVLSAPSATDKQQRWQWTVPAAVPAAEYFIEVTSQRKDSFAYTQAFDLLGA